MFIGFLLAVFPVFGADQEYRWPLDLAPQLTSSFAEYRPGRFHAGLDLRTSGIGREVFAADEGHISRVVCSPEGYGKAVYLALDDGNTVVYAHLDDYFPELAEYVRMAQHKAKRYTVNLYPERNQFRVKRGQLIAKSGQTGIGAPHLHYELRDSAQQPTNPRTLGISWPDTTRPKLTQLVVIPKGAGDQVGGDFKPQIHELRHEGNGQYTTDPVRVRGAVGFGLNLVDPGSGGYNLGVHRMRLLRGDTELFRVQHDLISYDNNHHGAVAYHPLLGGRGRFLLLYRWPGNDAKSYQHSTSEGWFEVTAEDTQVTIEVTDFMGNQAILNIPLLASTPEVIPVPSGGVQGEWSVEVDSVGTHVLITARFTGPESETPVAFLERDDVRTSVPFLRVGIRTFRAAVAPTESGRHTLHVTHPRMKARETTFEVFSQGETRPQVQLGDLEFRVQTDSAFGALFVRVDVVPVPSSAPIKALGTAYRIWPENSPIDARVEIRFPVPEGIEEPRRVHLYRKSARGWERYPTTWTDHRLSISTRQFGTFVVMEDTKVPVIRNVRPANGKTFSTKRPVIRATITDEGSGIDQIEITCGGQWLLTAYDPERQRIDWTQDEDLPSGRQDIIITITDKAGNVETVTRSVTVPG